jgi:hypothetical protein
LAPNEDALIGAFVKRNKRDRYREILSNPRLRHKFTKLLAHFTDFDPKYRLPIASDKLYVDNIARELKKRHCPSLVYTISEDPRIDQTELPLILFPAPLPLLDALQRAPAVTRAEAL